MIKAIRLGDSLRRRVMRQRPDIRDALLAEEQRMSDEIIRMFVDEGGFVYDSETLSHLSNMPENERKALDHSFSSYFDLLALETEKPTHYIFGWGSAFEGEEFDSFILPEDLPITIELDVDRDRHKDRFILKAAFINNHGEAISEPSYELRGNSFERTFVDYWIIIQQELDQEFGRYTEKEWQNIQDERRKNHSVISGQVRGLFEEANFNVSDKMIFELTMFLAHLWPHRDNPVPKGLIDGRRIPNGLEAKFGVNNLYWGLDKG